MKWSSPATARVCRALSAVAPKRTAPPPIMPRLLTAMMGIYMDVTEAGGISPPGQSFLQDENGWALKNGSHFLAGFRSRKSQSSSEEGSQPAASAASKSTQYPAVNPRSSSKWLMSVPGNLVVMFRTGHRKTGDTKFSSWKRVHSW